MSIQNIQEKIQAILNTEIAEVREWAFVYWVRPRSGRPTLVSKKAVPAISEPATLEPLRFTLPSSGRRGARKPWVARIDGVDEKWGLARTFIEPVSIKWGKRGCDSAVFEITDLGYFQDRDGYWEAIIEDGAISCRQASADEVKYVMAQRCASVGQQVTA